MRKFILLEAEIRLNDGGVVDVKMTDELRVEIAPSGGIIQANDIITSVDGKDVSTKAELEAAVAGKFGIVNCRVKRPSPSINSDLFETNGYKIRVVNGARAVKEEFLLQMGCASGYMGARIKGDDMWLNFTTKASRDKVQQLKSLSSNGISYELQNISETINESSKPPPFLIFKFSNEVPLKDALILIGVHGGFTNSSLLSNKALDYYRIPARYCTKASTKRALELGIIVSGEIVKPTVVNDGATGSTSMDSIVSGWDGGEED